MNILPLRMECLRETTNSLYFVSMFSGNAINILESLCPPKEPYLPVYCHLLFVQGPLDFMKGLLGSVEGHRPRNKQAGLNILPLRYL